MHSCCHGNIHYTYHLILSELFGPLIVLQVRSILIYFKNMQNLENLDIFEIFITQKLLKCLKNPLVRSVLKYFLQFIPCVYHTVQGMSLNSFFNQFHVPFARIAGHDFECTFQSIIL